MIDEREMVVKPGEEYPIPSENVTVQKLPVVILVDTSISMTSDLPGINAGVNKMVRDIQAHDVANQQVELCVISFNDVATLEQNWKPVNQMKPIEFIPSGCTNLEAGLTMALNKSRERSDYYEHLGTQVSMPFLITITDGHANSGDFNAICNEIRNREKESKIRPFTIAVSGYDKKTIAKLSDKKRVLEFTGPDNHNYMEFFNFLTTSLKVMSISSLNEAVNVKSNLGDPSKGSCMQIPDFNDWLNS